MAKKIKEVALPNNTLTMISKDSFSKEVDQFISDSKSDILSAIIEIATRKKIEIESVSKFLSPSLKSRLEAEMTSLRMLKKKKG